MSSCGGLCPPHPHPGQARAARGSGPPTRPQWMRGCAPRPPLWGLRPHAPLCGGCAPRPPLWGLRPHAPSEPSRSHRTSDGVRPPAWGLCPHAPLGSAASVTPASPFPSFRRKPESSRGIGGARPSLPGGRGRGEGERAQPAASAPVTWPSRAVRLPLTGGAGGSEGRAEAARADVGSCDRQAGRGTRGAWLFRPGSRFARSTRQTASPSAGSTPEVSSPPAASTRSVSSPSAASTRSASSRSAAPTRSVSSPSAASTPRGLSPSVASGPVGQSPARAEVSGSITPLPDATGTGDPVPRPPRRLTRPAARDHDRGPARAAGRDRRERR